MKTEAEAQRAVAVYADTVRRVCFMYLRNHADTEDVFQEVFLKFVRRDEPFESDAHERAWLIRVAVNACKDTLRSFFRRKVRSIEEADVSKFTVPEEDFSVLDAVLRLPQNYKAVVYLHYYEGYTAPEIASLLGKRENTVYTWLSRAREKLKTELSPGRGGERFGA